MRSADTEAAGLDLYHGVKPYLFTTTDTDLETVFWEWDVDPLTREPIIPESDLDEIEELILEEDEWVFQNPKFDVKALGNIRQSISDNWPWKRTRDTLLAGHLVRSDTRHDLTHMAMRYLRVNVQPYEDAIQEATKAARTFVKKAYPDWIIAKKGDPSMPSTGDPETKGSPTKLWKGDMWLPRAVAKAEGYPEDHPWWTVLSKYAISDSTTTIALYQVLLEEIKKKGLEKIYAERLKLLPIVFQTEENGVTLSGDRLKELMTEYGEGVDRSKKVCVSIAKNQDYELDMPKGSVNNSLRGFADLLFRNYGIQPALTDKGHIALDKDNSEKYLLELPERSWGKKFLEKIREKNQRGTAVSYMRSYERYWVPLGVYDDYGRQLWYRLHPSLNPTGTSTLRWSSSNPNEQNISKKEGFNLRYCFGAAPGREWWSLDAKNIELRIPAYESGEAELIALFEKPNEAPYYGSQHLLNFSTVYPDIWEEELAAVGIDSVGPHCKKKYASTWYQWCKNGGFAVQYGAVEQEDGTGTADKAFHRPGSHAKLKSRFSKQEELNQQCIAHAKRFGYVETIPDRTVDPDKGYPVYCKRGDRGQVKPTIPLNYHVQSTAMWWMMKAMIRVSDYLGRINEDRPAHRRYLMVMQVHDELVFDFPAAPKNWKRDPQEYNKPKIRMIKRLMEQGGDDLGLPTPVSCEYHPNNWSEGIGVTV